MMTVIQAIRSEKYRMDSDVSGGGVEVDSSQKPKELQEELSKIRADYEARITDLQAKHEEVLQEAKKFQAAVPRGITDHETEVRNYSRAAHAGCTLYFARAACIVHEALSVSASYRRLLSFVLTKR